MDDSLKAQVDHYLSHLNLLIRRGCELRDALATAPAGDPSLFPASRMWQQDCGTAVNQLSGGSKAHWLARAYSEAFLMRTPDPSAAQQVPPAEIVSRLIGVLEQAVASLSRTDSAALLASSSAPAPRRFDFVHNPELRPVLEQAYGDGIRALEHGDYREALLTYCGVLESIVTDAIEHKGTGTLASADTPAGQLPDWPFETRLEIAEKLALIRGGYARLPDIARHYRTISESAESVTSPTITERDARVTGQVLNVIMRDLNPGR